LFTLNDGFFVFRSSSTSRRKKSKTVAPQESEGEDGAGTSVSPEADDSNVNTFLNLFFLSTFCRNLSHMMLWWS
jgi:hypothetical protein